MATPKKRFNTSWTDKFKNTLARFGLPQTDILEFEDPTAKGNWGASVTIESQRRKKTIETGDNTFKSKKEAPEFVAIQAIGFLH